MGLTLPHGPLSGDPPPSVNYGIDGPAHRLFFEDFPRRVRADFGGETVLDTDRGKLLHETGLLPRLYVPADDVREALLEVTDHQTVCPFKGQAAYWSLVAGGRRAENAVWSYPEPKPESAWLRGYFSLHFDAADAWFDEDEEIEGHLRDPYHRVDARHSRRRVRVRVEGVTVAETERPVVLSETGLTNRYYLPPEDVRRELLTASDTRTVCPYKGTASYWSLAAGERRVADVAWEYPEPLENAAKVRGYLCFPQEDWTVEVDGRPAT